MPRQILPRAIEREYARAIGDLLSSIVKEAFAPVLAALPSILDGQRVSLALDSEEDTRRAERLLAEASARMRAGLSPERINGIATRMAQSTALHNRTQIGRQVRSAIGIDPGFADRSVRPRIVASVAENVALIKGIASDTATAIEKRVTRAVANGTRHEALAKELAKDFDLPERRAKLIARDQVGKLYGQINATRQKELGIDRFVWRTVGDDRVREEHQDRDGQIYSYSDPPDGELPGEPILCRCNAEPYFGDLT